LGIPHPAGPHGRAVEHDLEGGADGGANDSHGVDVIHGPRAPSANLDCRVTVVLEVEGELGLPLVGHVGLILLAGENGGAVDAEAIAGFAEEFGDGTAADAPNGIPHGVFHAGPALRAGLAGVHLKAAHMAVDGEQVIADERGFDPIVEEIGIDADEGGSGDA
jgi:hypothetical protein